MGNVDPLTVRLELRSSISLSFPVNVCSITATILTQLIDTIAVNEVDVSLGKGKAHSNNQARYETHTSPAVIKAPAYIEIAVRYQESTCSIGNPSDGYNRIL